MQPSKKMILVACGGLFVSGLFAMINMHKVVFIIYNTCLIIATVVDHYMTKETFKIERSHSEKLSLGEEENISFSVYNTGDTPLNIKIKDTIDQFAFDKIIDIATGIITPHEKEAISYTILPKKRGLFKLDTIHIAYLSRYKLLYKYKTEDLPMDIKVYPDLKDLRKYRLMVINGNLMRGEKKIWNKRGEGLEFESLKEYVSGDPYNKINWKATARENKPITNQYEIEKNQDVIAVIDSGKAMSYEVRGYKKLDLAINTALILSDITNATGDKSGLMVFNREVQQYVKPSSGSAHRNKLMEALYTVEYSRDMSDFSIAFTHLSSYQKKRSIICIFTEFETMDEAEEYVKILPLISKRHLVMLFMMTKEKVIALTEGEKTENKDIFIKGAALEILNERKRILGLLRRSGIMCIECTPETLTTEVINRYIMLKQKNFVR